MDRHVLHIRGFPLAKRVLVLRGYFHDFSQAHYFCTIENCLLSHYTSTIRKLYTENNAICFENNVKHVIHYVARCYARWCIRVYNRILKVTVFNQFLQGVHKINSS